MKHSLVKAQIPGKQVAGGKCEKMQPAGSTYNGKHRKINWCEAQENG